MNNVVSAAQYDDIDGIITPAQNTFYIGHDVQRCFLAQMLAENRLHHALLMEGPRGVGKASLAYRLAYYLLTKNQNTTLITQRDIAAHIAAHINDDELSSATNISLWQQIAQGVHPNFLHISRGFDVKTEKFRGAITIDDIRKIIHFLHQTSFNDDWRVVIIDAAEDMNRNSANALLKTLEEPPKRTLFMLISHNSGRLLPTIRSRCQTIIFKPLLDNEVRDALRHAVGYYDDTSGQQDIDVLVKNSEGSVRQAALMFAYGGLDIIDAVENILSQTSFSVDNTFKLATILSAKDAQVQFSFFVDYVLDRVAQLARDKAMLGDLIGAQIFSQFWHEIDQQINEANAYNLDKKQSIIILLQKLHKTLARCLAES